MRDVLCCMATSLPSGFTENGCVLVHDLGFIQALTIQFSYKHVATTPQHGCMDSDQATEWITCCYVYLLAHTVVCAEVDVFEVCCCFGKVLIAVWTPQPFVVRETCFVIHAVGSTEYVNALVSQVHIVWWWLLARLDCSALQGRPQVPRLGFLGVGVLSWGSLGRNLCSSVDEALWVGVLYFKLSHNRGLLVCLLHTWDEAGVPAGV